MADIETITLGNPIENVDLNINPQTSTNLSGVELLANQSKLKQPDNYENIDDLEMSLNNLVGPEVTTDLPTNKSVENNSTTDPHTKSWDGFSTYNNIPTVSESHQTKEDILREKFKYVRLLEDLEKKGVHVSQKYTMESSLLDMKGEYETIKNEKEKQNSIQFQGKILMAL